MPFFTAIIALIGTIGTFVASLGGIGAALLSIGLNLAAQYVLKLFAKKPPSGVELEVQFGESISRTVSYGLTASAGHLIYVNSYGPANSALQHIRVISDFYTTSLEKVYINGKLETLGATSALGKIVSSGEFANRIWIKFVDGRQTAPDPIIITNSNPAGRYDATDALLGCSYVIITMAFDREVLNSVPEFLFEYKGAPIYDWRKDTSVGGLGTHRFNDINTWEYSANPILLAYAYHRGIKINGDIFAGMEVAESDLPLGKWSTACNICDEAVDTEKRYAISFQVNCSETHGDNIDAIMRSCGGFISEGVEGIWPIVGSNQTVVATFTDDDIIVDSPKTFRRYRPMSELVNSVSGTFISPEQQWSSAGYTRAFDAGLLTVDRKTRDVDMNFDTVNSLRQASQLAAIYFKENRYEKTATLTLRPFFQDLEVGDWIQWNSDISYKTGIYMVSGYELVSDSDEEGPRNVRIQLVERGSQMYDAVTPIPFPTIINPAEPIYQQELVNFAAVGQTIVGANSIQQSGIRVSWNTPTDPSVAGVIIEYRVKGGPADAIIIKTVNNGAIVTILSDGVVKNTVYEVRHRLITDPFRFTVPSAWIEVTSSNAENAIDWEDLNKTVRDVIDSLGERQLDLTYDVELDRWHDILGMAGTLVESSQHQVETANSRAMVRRETRILAEADSALAAQITTVETELVGKASTTVTETLASRTTATENSISTQGAVITSINNQLLGFATQTAFTALQSQVSLHDGEINALQSYDISLTQRVGNVDLGGLFSMVQEIAPAGWLTQISAFVRATVGGVTTRAGWFARVRSTGGANVESDFGIFAKRFLIADDAGNVTAFFDPAGLKVQAAFIGNLSADTITTGTLSFERLADASVPALKLALGIQKQGLITGTVTTNPISEFTALFEDANVERTIFVTQRATATINWPTTDTNPTFKSITLSLKVDDGFGNNRVLYQVTNSVSGTTPGSLTVDANQLDLYLVKTKTNKTIRLYWEVQKTYNPANVSSTNTNSLVLYWTK